MAGSNSTPWLVGAIVALMGGGGWTFINALFQARKPKPVTVGGASAHDGQGVGQQVDASILAIARARDELEDENARLRRVHAEEQAAWNAERVRLREEIARLHTEIERVRAEADQRYAALLRRVESLQRRTDQTPPDGVETSEPQEG